MFSGNGVWFIGRSTRDAETKAVGSSTVTTFRLVSNERIKRRSGEYEDKPTYIDCEVWNNSATFAYENIKKGTPVHVVGKLETDEWEKDGQRRSKLKIYVMRLQVDRPKQSEQSEAEPVGAAAKSDGDNELPF